jgi:hypothetical protein
VDNLLDLVGKVLGAPGYEPRYFDFGPVVDVVRIITGQLAIPVVGDPQSIKACIDPLSTEVPRL